MPVCTRHIFNMSIDNNKAIYISMFIGNIKLIILDNFWSIEGSDDTITGARLDANFHYTTGRGISNHWKKSE